MQTLSVRVLRGTLLGLYNFKILALRCFEAGKADVNLLPRYLTKQTGQHQRR